MSGSISTISLEQLRRAKAGDQRTFRDFAGDDVTYIAPVRSKTNDINDQVDEVIPELGPSSSLLHHFLRERSEFMDEGYSKETAHNKAWDNINYSDRYMEYLWSEDAQARVAELAQRVEDGEKIVLVCYCKDDMKCHRDLLRFDIEEWIKIMDRV